jgi:hypothetical protein
MHIQFCQALYRDLRKPLAESKITEISMVFSEVELLLDNIHKWAKPVSVSNPARMLYPLDTYESATPSMRLTWKCACLMLVRTRDWQVEACT